MQTENNRIHLLDILRGFAILGTLGTNIWIFAYLGDISYIFSFEHHAFQSFNDFIRTFVLFVINGKFLGILTIMFGVGLELKYQQSLRQGRSWPGAYLWIALFLLLESFIHFTLVMEYDILMSYAITAMIVSMIVRYGEKAINIAMLLFGGFHILMISLLFLLDISGQLGQVISFGDMRQVVTLYQEGSWLEQVQYRVEHFWELRSEAFFIIPMNIFLFLLGVRLMRSGAFSPNANGKKIRRKLLRIGLYLGLPLNLLIFVPGGNFDFPVRYLFAPILSVGYMALIAIMLERGTFSWMWSGLEAVGKMALSCYVFQNIAASILFYGWGLKLGGQYGSLGIVGIWVLISLFQIIFACAWLKVFKQGPLELGRKGLLRATDGGLFK